MAWLEQLELPEQLRPTGAPAPEITLAVRAWNFMGGLDWAALPIVAELLGIRDLEVFIHQLVTIRDRNKEQ